MQPQLQQTLTNTNNCTSWHSTSCSGDSKVPECTRRLIASGHGGLKP